MPCKRILTGKEGNGIMSNNNNWPKNTTYYNYNRRRKKWTYNIIFYNCQ